MAAVPDEVLVAIDPTVLEDPNVPDVFVNLATESERVAGQLAELGAVFEEADNSGDAAVLRFQPGTISAQAVLGVLPDLQSRGRRVDLNYLEPLQPNDAFRPDDDPVQVSASPAAFLGQTRSVLVIDSPEPGEQVDYDVEDNGYVDEDHGHGPFVLSMIQRSGPSVRLTGVPVDTTFTLPPNDRWSPMMFNDFSIIQALNSYDNENLVNLSLGGTGCPLDESTPGVGERLVLAQVMSNMVNTKESLEWFVAAAGNDGTGTTLQFPAAWRDPRATQGLVNFLNGLGATFVADEIAAIRQNLEDAIIAVGSVETEPAGTPRNDLRSDFSNCGAWINAAAYGRWQVGQYPSSAEAGYPGSAAGPARWSGTSFSTANFTAALASGLVNPDPAAFDSSAFDSNTGARMMDPGSGFACSLPSSTGLGTPPP
jgi:hypothetical protein